ncbi:hypothetical protein QYE76_018925 [Lolium multiflorum]|uniref:Uncharacterized protein n=1 Tax=Lolium multiflorum TaxID=4521 RepID=A0AAD8VCD1_LOLMU|nr:hypothetical protein QYE76_018925 [Lolium multiflorum]
MLEGVRGNRVAIRVTRTAREEEEDEDEDGDEVVELEVELEVEVAWEEMEVEVEVEVEVEEAETESRAEEDSSRGFETPEEDGRPKPLKIRGEARVPDERKEPKTHEEKTLIIPAGPDNWTFPPGVKGRQPSSMIGALLRKFWPGKYYPLGTVPAGEKKLATTWTDYESAPGVGFPTAAEAVMRKFWCFYRVAPEVEETAANRTLRATCERLTPQVWYNQRITSAGHFWAQRGERVQKPDIVGKNAKAEYEMTVEDYMSVIPDWAEPHAEAWEEMVRTRWLKMDEDFAAVARRNAENRGDGGTHCGGNLSYERYKGKTRAALGPEEEMSDLEIYNKMRLKKPDLSQPQPSLPEYFGTYAEDVENYCAMVRHRHPEVDDPMSAEVDEESLVLSSGGLPHGRLAMLNKAVKHTLTTTFTRLKAGLTKDSPPLPPRRRPDFEAAYVAAHQEYQVAFNQQQQFMEYMAYIHVSSNLCVDGGQSNWTDSGFRDDASLSGPAPNMPSKENFAAEYYGRTAGTGCSGNQGGGREITPVHHGGPSPGATPATCADGHYADGCGQPSAHSVYADGRRYAEGHVECAEAHLPRGATPRGPVGVVYAEGQ